MIKTFTTINLSETEYALHVCYLGSYTESIMSNHMLQEHFLKTVNNIYADFLHDNMESLQNQHDIISSSFEIIDDTHVKITLNKPENLAVEKGDSFYSTFKGIAFFIEDLESRFKKLLTEEDL